MTLIQGLTNHLKHGTVNMKRKSKRFDEGGLSEDDQSLSDYGTATAPPGEASGDIQPARPMSFKEAFASARSGGDKVFNWNGKNYTTELAKPSPAPSSKASPAFSPAFSPASSPAFSPAPKAETKTQIKKTSTNPNVPTPEEAASNRKEAAETIGKVVSGIGSYLKDTFTPSGRMAVEKRREANKATPGFKKGGTASSRKTESKGSGRIDTSNVNKKTLLPESKMAKGGKITHYKSASAAVKAAEKRGDKSITVKFSSASKRADGIATKGHTKGRYM